MTAQLLGEPAQSKPCAIIIMLTGKMSMIDFFWKKLNTPLLAAIIAASIYSKLINYYTKQQIQQIKLLNDGKHTFQGRANEVRNRIIRT
jgi:hypothetical protein